MREIFNPEVCSGNNFIDELYSATTSTSQLRRYFVEICAFNWLKDEEDGLVESWKSITMEHEIFGLEVSKIEIRSRPSKDADVTKSHPYHWKEFQRLQHKAALES